MMFLRRRIRKLNTRAAAAWEQGLADSVPHKLVYRFAGRGPELYAYKAAIEAARVGNPPRFIPNDVWAEILAEDARGW